MRPNVFVRAASHDLCRAQARVHATCRATAVTVGSWTSARLCRIEPHYKLHAAEAGTPRYCTGRGYSDGAPAWECAQQCHAKQELGLIWAELTPRNSAGLRRWRPGRGPARDRASGHAAGASWAGDGQAGDRRRLRRHSCRAQQPAARSATRALVHDGPEAPC